MWDGQKVPSSPVLRAGLVPPWRAPSAGGPLPDTLNFAHTGERVQGFNAWRVWIVWIHDIKLTSFSLGEPTVSSTNQNCINSFDILRTIFLLLFLCLTTWVTTVPPVDVLALWMKPINLISYGVNLMKTRNGRVALLPLWFAVFFPGISFLNGLNLI